MDDLDRAEQLAQQQRDLSINAALQSGIETEQPDEDEDGTRYCIDCGTVIPKERLAVRPESVRCVDCKQLKEERNR